MPHLSLWLHLACAGLLPTKLQKEPIFIALGPTSISYSELSLKDETREEGEMQISGLDAKS